MKRHIVFICLFIVPFLALLPLRAQQLNHTDSKGMKQGLWKTYYAGGSTLKSEGTYKNNKPLGMFRLYFETGPLKAEMNYREDFKTCDAVLYASLGHKMAEGKYIDRKKEGEWKYYSEETGLLRSVENYKADVLNGPYKVYYRDTAKVPAVMEEGIYVAGKREGQVKQYYSDGKPHSTFTYKAGVACGPVVYYYPSGAKQVQGQHDEAGKRHGMWIKYDEKGVPKDKLEYRHGSAQGKDLKLNMVPEKPIQVNTPDGIKE